MPTQMVNVHFKETVVYATRSYAAGEDHQLPEVDAKALGDSVDILGPATSDFPDYSKSVYGDNQAAKEREPHDPQEEEPVTAGETMEETTQEPKEEQPEAKQVETAPENKMVKGAPKKK